MSSSTFEADTLREVRLIPLNCEMRLIKGRIGANEAKLAGHLDFTAL